MRHPHRPPLDGLRRRMSDAREGRVRGDGFVRQTFRLPRNDARAKAREWFDAYPKAAYWTEIESWYALPGDVIEFTMRRLPMAD